MKSKEALSRPPGSSRFGDENALRVLSGVWCLPSSCGICLDYSGCEGTYCANVFLS